MKVQIATLIRDDKLYPRTMVDKTTVRRYQDAMLNGDKFPPLIVDKKTKRLVDGFHRFEAAILAYGEGAVFEIEEREYKNDQEIFLDIVDLNSPHGKPLTPVDRARCAIIGSRLGISADILAIRLRMPKERFCELIQKRTAFLPERKKDPPTRKKNTQPEPIALKGTIQHLAGQTLTNEQVIGNDKLQGMRPLFYINQMRILITTDGFIDRTNEKVMDGLKNLYVLLGRFLG